MILYLSKTVTPAELRTLARKRCQRQRERYFLLGGILGRMNLEPGAVVRSSPVLTKPGSWPQLSYLEIKDCLPRKPLTGLSGDDKKR